MATQYFEQPLLALPGGTLPVRDARQGEVFTRRWVVDLVLDLAGYTSERDLTRSTLVEPACGGGAFLLPVTERLLASTRLHGRDVSELHQCVRAFDVVAKHVATTRVLVAAALEHGGANTALAADLANAWVRADDYLLEEGDPTAADFVVGNPPYVRLEDVHVDYAAAYRRQWKTMAGRADLFVGFFEKGLRSLRTGGVLGFICADRWMRNQYGRDLRDLISRGFSVDTVVTMHDVDAFEDAVSAYPAITIIRKAAQAPALVVDTTIDFGPSDTREVVQLSRTRNLRSADSADSADSAESANAITVVGSRAAYSATTLPHWFSGPDSWPQGSPARLAMLEDLAARFPLLEDAWTSTKVGIGVATGADKAFIVSEAVDVEHDRLLPLALVRDVASGQLAWSGHYLVNPWQASGLVSLDEYPRLAAYYAAHNTALRGRYVARDNRGWYRTIDRVDPALTRTAKLLIPDMKMTLHPVLDTGTTYPHHNLYHVTSGTWDLQVLGGLLMSRVANAFVEAYAVRMRGGTLRFQAQYLRRIRVPSPASISPLDADAMRAAFTVRDVDAATDVALRLYGLTNLPTDAFGDAAGSI